MMNPEPVRVLIVDDHEPFRNGLRTLLSSVAGIDVIGEAGNGKDAISLTEENQPDIILMDIQMPGMNGIEATRLIHQSSPHIGIVVLTMFEDDDSVFASMRAGARGYLLKGADQSEILRAIQSVQSGEALFGPGIARRLINFFTNINPPQGEKPFPELTDREHEVLDLIAQGASNNQISQHLVISQKTVRNHVSNIFSKLQVVDRAQAIIRARDAGMGTDEHPK
ncbi:MAG TPA: response regulator transcription factor [Anaerolineales bacterium]|nr:response regulator transcription factor [Anaerolineales bacterium]